MMARLPGTISAAPNPCTARAMIRKPGFGATAQISDATTNSTMPSAKTFLRPKRSPAAPPISSSEARNSI